MRRFAIGIIALLLLVAAALLWVWPTGDGYPLYLGACLRVGAVMAVFWLAYYDVSRLPPWAWAVLPLVLVLVALGRRGLLIGIPIVIALVVFKPRRRTPG
jgi:hypothetical protein